MELPFRTNVEAVRYFCILSIHCLFLLLFVGCRPNYYPNSVLPGVYSTNTGLEYGLNGNFVPNQNYNGFQESKLIRRKSIKQETTPQRTKQEKRAQAKAQWAAMMQISSNTALANISASPPGGVYIHQLQLYADEVEVTNLHWQEFLYYIRRDSSILYYLSQLPDTTVIQLRQSDYYYLKDLDGEEIREITPVTAYQYHPEYLFYPVVGVSYEQAVEYCNWRSAVVTALYNSNPKRFGSSTNIVQKLRFTYRLPTEQEWEVIAAAGLDPIKFPYSGATGGTLKYKVNPEAAAHIAMKINSPKSVAQIKQDLKQTEVKDLYFNVQRPLPYFLQFNTPAYVYSGFAQDYGLFNLLGNVAEMVAEKGVAKGGSWKDEFSDSRITNRQTYTEPSEKIGFRCVCEIEVLEQ